MNPSSKPANLLMSERADRLRRLGSFLLHAGLVLIASVSALSVMFIIFYIARDAVPFFKIEGFRHFFTTADWYPSRTPGEFGALAIFFGSALVTLCAVIVAVPLGIAAAVALSDILSFNLRQYAKPLIEMLAAIPSVAYGFFALIVLAPLLQSHGGRVLSLTAWIVGLPILLLLSFMLADILNDRLLKGKRPVSVALFGILGGLSVALMWILGGKLDTLQIASGTNALNVSLILGIMALPTVVSVSEDALQAVGRELREGSYALGATRAETILRVVIPAAASGIVAAVILGVMRAIGETMVVWMASGNAAQIPHPWYNLLEPVRTLTATIAGDMGEADQVTGSARYHVLFAMALCLMLFSFLSNLVSEWFVQRTRKRLKGA